MSLQAQIQRKQQELATVTGQYTKFWDEIGEKDLTADERTKSKDLGRKADELAADLKEMIERAEKSGEIDALMAKFGKPVNGLGNGGIKADDSPSEEKSLSLIHLLKNSDEFKGQHKNSPTRIKTLITSSTSSAGDLLVPERLNALYDSGTFRRPLTVIDLIKRISVSSESVEYPFLSSVTNNAGPVAIADSISTSDDTGRFAESAMVWDKASVTMKWIGHTIPIPESVLSDIGQLMSWVNEFLIYGVLEELEDQIITGDGTGENLTGILSTSGIQTQAFSNSMLETLRKAKTKVRKTGRVQKAAIVLTPENYESIELTQDAEMRYLLGGPVGQMAPTLWGMPVVESEGLTANHAIVGGFDHCAIFDRQQIEVSTSTENRDFFEKNLVALRARYRGQFGVMRPKAFVDVTMA